MEGGRLSLADNTLAHNGLANLCCLHKGAEVQATHNQIGPLPSLCTACAAVRCVRPLTTAVDVLTECSRSAGVLVGAGGNVSLTANTIQINALDGVLVCTQAYGDGPGVISSLRGNIVGGNGGAALRLQVGRPGRRLQRCTTAPVQHIF
jgi:hypothetical protein